MKRIVFSLLALGAVAGAMAQQGSKSRLVEGTYKSELLGVEKSYTVYLPAGYDTDPQKKYPVLYILHGAGDAHTCWRDRGSVQRYADEQIEAGMCLPMILVMPNAQGEDENRKGRNMGYFNQPGWPYEDHFFREFIPHIERTYRIVGDRKHRAMTGQSMGGGGTAAYAQRHPDMFSSACPLSGALASMSGVVRDATPEQVEALRSVRWWMDCGDDDFLLQANFDFFSAMKAKGVPIQFTMRNGGHNWEYWRVSLPSVLTFVSIGFSE